VAQFLHDDVARTGLGHESNAFAAAQMRRGDPKHLVWLISRRKIKIERNVCIEYSTPELPT
jgi:hypothetical protein